MKGLCLVCYNLKPKKMGDFSSNGMVLFAGTSDHSVLELVVPPEGSVPGERCTLEGDTTIENHKAPEFASNKTLKVIFKNDDFRTNDDCVVCFKGKVLKTSKGVVKGKTLKNCNVS